MIPGRNDPCPCGSGKKYKHCCLRTQEAVSPEELTWQRVRRANDGLDRRLLDAAAKHFGPTGIDEAWAEFTLWDDEAGGLDPGTPHMQVFAPWFLYDWLPDPQETETPPESHQLTAAQAYLRAAGRRLEPLTKRYLEAGVAAPFSFHEILDCEPGRGFRLRDVLLGTEASVLERSASRGVRAGDLIFAKVVPIDGIAVLDGSSPVAIPPGEKPRIIELRKNLAHSRDLFGSELLREYGVELLGLYHDIVDRLLDPRPPQLANTDGEPLEFQRLVYDLDSPLDAFEKLKDLAVGLRDEEIRDGAVFDDAGALVRAELDWRRPGNAMHSYWDNTILGHLRIADGCLRAEVNSAERAARLRALVEERLGSSARFRVAKIESAQSMFERARAAGEDRGSEELATERRRLAATPEARTVLAEQLRAHYRSWLDSKLPALGDRTPREAAGDADGREALEALVLQIERDGEVMQPPLDPSIPRELREALGLAWR